VNTGGSLKTFFNPRTVAVIGAGRTSGVGAAIFRNLAEAFAGRVFPVNPRASSIGLHRCFEAVTTIPDEVDLARGLGFTPEPEYDPFVYARGRLVR